MLQEKRYYLKQLESGPLSHRKIMNRMLDKFDVSVATVRNELLAEGLIVLHSVKRIGSTQKMDSTYKLTNKKMIPNNPQPIVFDGCWPDGSKKSTENAFNWNNGQKSIFSKKDVADSLNKGKPANYNPNPITTFSRA